MLKMEIKRKLLGEKLRKEVEKELMEEERIRKELERKERMKQRIEELKIQREAERQRVEEEKLIKLDEAKKKQEEIKQMREQEKLRKSEERKFWELEQAKMKEELRAKLIEERKKGEKQINQQKDITSIDPRQICIIYKKKEETKAIAPSSENYILNEDEIRKKLVEARIRVEADLKMKRDKGEQRTSPTIVISKDKKKSKKEDEDNKDSKDTYGNLIFKSWPGDGKTEDIDMSEWSRK
jgi:membrane protein involved in colicin uptake